MFIFVCSLLPSSSCIPSIQPGSLWLRTPEPWRRRRRPGCRCRRRSRHIWWLSGRKQMVCSCNLRSCSKYPTRYVGVGGLCLHSFFMHTFRIHAVLLLSSRPGCDLWIETEILLVRRKWRIKQTEHSLEWALRKKKQSPNVIKRAPTEGWRGFNREEGSE